MKLDDLVYLSYEENSINTITHYSIHWIWTE